MQVYFILMSGVSFLNDASIEVLLTAFFPNGKFVNHGPIWNKIEIMNTL